MRIVSERQLAIMLGAQLDAPRVVVGGNFATPWRALAVLDGTLETVNDPAQIARRPRMTSVNGALRVDLFAQSTGRPRSGAMARPGRRADH